MVELSFMSCTSCWSCLFFCFSDSSWLWFVDEVDRYGGFSLVFMIKVLSCSTAAGLFPSVLPLLVFLFKLALLFLLFKMQKQLLRGVIGKGVLKIFSWFPGEHPCRSAISIKLLWHGCSPMKLLQTSRTTFLNNTSG